MGLKTNDGIVTGVSIKVMLMHHDGDNLDYENDKEDDQCDEYDDQIRTDQQKAGTLIWPHQVKYIRFQDEDDYVYLAIDGYR